MARPERDKQNRKRISLGSMVSLWLLATVAALVAAFVLIAFVYGRGDFPQTKDSPGWIYEVTRSAIPLAAVVGGAAAVALAIRRQTTAEEAHKLALEQNDRDRVSELRSRFTTAAAQLAHESAAIRLAGVYALAALADDWHDSGDQREAQVCINLLCAYQRNLRPRAVVPGETSSAETGETQVRSTISTVIANHLRGPHDGGPGKWSHYEFDFTGAHFDAGTHDFRGVTVSGRLDFRHTIISNSTWLNFIDLDLRSGLVDFTGCRLLSGYLIFQDARIADAAVLRLDSMELEEFVHLILSGLTVSGRLDASTVTVGPRANVSGSGLRVQGGTVNATSVTIHGGHVSFARSHIEPGSRVALWALTLMGDGVIDVHSSIVKADTEINLRGLAVERQGEEIHLAGVEVDAGSSIRTGAL